MREFILERLREIIDNLTIYDQLAFGALGLTFILFLILMVVFKNTLLRIFMALLTVMVLIVGPFGVKFALDSIIRKVEVKVSETKRLTFANTLVISGTLKNSGKIDYTKCKISANVINKIDNVYLKYITLYLTPKYKAYESVDLKGLPLKVGEDMVFRVTIENFLPTEDFEVDVRGVCY